MSNQKQSLSAPPPAAPQQNVEQEYQNARQEFESAFKDFHQNYFLSKVLDANKSPAVKNTEQAAIDRMIKSIVSLNKINDGEGTIAMMIILVREQCALRDRNNELEYDLCKAIRDLGNIQKELGIENGKQKR